MQTDFIKKNYPLKLFNSQYYIDKLIKDNMLKEQNLAKTSIENLKLYGLSSQKSHYLSNLASLVNNKDIDIATTKT